MPNIKCPNCEHVGDLKTFPKLWKPRGRPVGSRTTAPCNKCGNPAASSEWYYVNPTLKTGRACIRCRSARNARDYEAREKQPAYKVIMPTPEQEAASRAERDAAWEARNEEGRQREAKKRELENARAYRLLPEG